MNDEKKSLIRDALQAVAMINAADEASVTQKFIAVDVLLNLIVEPEAKLTVTVGDPGRYFGAPGYQGESAR